MLNSMLLRSVMVLCLVALAACSPAASSPSSSPASASASEMASQLPGQAEGTQIDVSLVDFEVQVSAATAPAGAVTFNITNDGDQAHEFVVIDTDTAAADLPTTDLTVDEEGDDITVVDEVEDIGPGATATLTVTLESGHYVLICNVPGHYMEGMRVDFDVE